MSVDELQHRLRQPQQDFILLDVREPWELDICALSGSVAVPLGKVPGIVDELDMHKETIIICHHGIRSQQVAYYLQHAGFENVFNVRGGFAAWAREIDPSMATY